jgi:hypothetical protein
MDVCDKHTTTSECATLCVRLQCSSSTRWLLNSTLQSVLPLCALWIIVALHDLRCLHGAAVLVLLGTSTAVHCVVPVLLINCCTFLPALLLIFSCCCTQFLEKIYFLKQKKKHFSTAFLSIKT